MGKYAQKQLQAFYADQDACARALSESSFTRCRSECFCYQITSTLRLRIFIKIQFQKHQLTSFVHSYFVLTMLNFLTSLFDLLLRAYY